MAVPTFNPTQTISSKPNYAKYLVYVLAVVGIGLLVYFGADLIKGLSGLGGKAGLSVEVVGDVAEVYLNDEYLGKTPFESKEIPNGENKISVKNASIAYDVNIDFEANSEVAMNRDLGVSGVFSSGQNFWLEKSDTGSVMSVLSEPSGAKVFIDNTQMGTTPFTTDTLSDGEYDLRVESPSYETQTARIRIQKGHKLNAVLKLFPLPVPSKVELVEGSTELFDIFTDESLVSSNTADWVKAVVYWNETRGLNLAGVGINKDLAFDYFVDYSGKIYNKAGEDITVEPILEDVSRGAYLRRVSDGPGLTNAASTVLSGLNVSTGKIAKILTTPTGWLNVRASASLNGEVMTQVDVGEEFAVLEEVTGWVKIKTSTSTEGWVYAQYVAVSE